jgi:hypothetical protein
MANKLKLKKDGKSQKDNPNNKKYDLLKEEKDLLIANMIIFKQREKEIIKLLKEELKNHKIYEWLKYVKGVGETMASVIVSEYDINKANTVSKMWAFTGLVPNMKKEKGKKCPYNQWLKSKMVGVLAGSFLKCKSVYSDFYYNYKNRIKEREKDWTPLHIDLASKRYMIKMFLKDLYVQWRTVEGLPVREPYQDEYLNKKHSAWN